MGWLRRCLEPYKTNPMRASGGHAAHGIDMSTSLKPGYESLDDFDLAECNIDIEPWVWNWMRGSYDRHFDAIVAELRTMPLHNPPYWTHTTGDVPPLPSTIWGGDALLTTTDTAGRMSRKQKKKKKEKKKNKKQPKKPTDQTGPGEQEATHTQTGTEQDSSQQQQRPAAGSSTQPNRGNLSNRDNMCYVSSVLQALCNVPGLREVITESKDFLYSITTGRGPGNGMIRVGDPGLKVHVELLAQLRELADSLIGTTKNIGSSPPRTFMETISRIRRDDCRAFKIGSEDDPSALLNVLLDILNTAGDRSEVLPDAPNTARPNERHDAEQKLIMLSEAGGHPPELRADIPDQYVTWRKIGNDSLIDSKCTMQIVAESQCTREDCKYRIDRSWQFLSMLEVNIRQQSQEDTRAYNLTELIDEALTAPAAAICGRDPSHGEKNRAKKRIVRTPPILIV